MPTLRLALTLVTSLVLGCGGSKSPPPPATPVEAAPAPDVAPPAKAAAPANDPGVLAASALAEQYAVGKQLYVDKKCANCHEGSGAGNAKNPPVIGETALPATASATAKLRKGVTFTTAKDVVDFVKAKMPLKKPGTLTDDEAYAVVAWLLDSNKVALTSKLDASNAAAINLR